MAMLTDKKIVLGVTGSISAYKSIDLARELVKRKASVHAVFTEHAKAFVTPLVFETITGNKVYMDMFELMQGSKIGHVTLAGEADLIVVAPATANTMSKVANGIADNLLTAMIMATKVPVLFAPAMNVHMWENIALQRSVSILREMGYHFVGPSEGQLACGVYGSGKLADVEEIVEKIEDIFTEKDLVGFRILVTAGPTQEPIDPVRIITNRSTGKMGFAVARVARRRGADVVLITGPSSESLRRRDIKVVEVRTAEEMKDAVMAEFGSCDVVIMTAAVADFKPKKFVEKKIKKCDSYLLELGKNPDILASLGKIKGDRVLVGFAAETEDAVDNGIEKMKKKNLDLVVINDVTEAGAGFGFDTNKVVIVDRKGKVNNLPIMPKEDVARVVLDKVRKLVKKKDI